MRYQNTEIYYESHGQGNPLVLLHGFLESGTIWKPFVNDLAASRQVIVIDLPGHGRSGNIEPTHSMELMANVVRRILEELGTEEITIVGHSMGGYVSLALCEKFPNLIKSLVLLNSTPEEDSEERKVNRDRAVKIIRENKEAYISMAISNLLTSEHNEKFKTEIENLKQEALKFSTEGIIAALLGMKIRTERISVLQNFNKSKILVAGMQDPVLEYDKILKISERCGCELITNNSGHLSFIENKTEIQKIMFLID